MGGSICRRLSVALAVLVGIGAAVLMGSGCAGTKMTSASGAPSVSAAPAEIENPPRYYDFTDILVPGDLKVEDKSTYVVQTAGFATGILVLEGRIKRNELISFFQTNMAKDNWKALSIFKSPRTSTFLLFKKTNRWCIISISPGDFYTRVEIGVSPAAGDTASGLYK